MSTDDRELVVIAILSKHGDGAVASCCKIPWVGWEAGIYNFRTRVSAITEEWRSHRKRLLPTATIRALGGNTAFFQIWCSCAKSMLFSKTQFTEESAQICFSGPIKREFASAADWAGMDTKLKGL